MDATMESEGKWFTSESLVLFSCPNWVLSIVCL
ncbi:unnamed protein product [Debaryomyces tyrocola]|nr:unnamed protein product [Debaryomyces tyrocola]